MSERQRILCEKDSDRDLLVQILVRNGYTVRHVRSKPEKGTKYNHYIEYWIE